MLRACMSKFLVTLVTLSFAFGLEAKGDPDFDGFSIEMKHRDQNAFHPGEAVLLEGVVKLHGPSGNNNVPITKILSKDYEIRAWFPNDQVEVTSQLSFSGTSPATFQYQSSPLLDSKENVFHIILTKKGNRDREIQELAGKLRTQISILNPRLSGDGGPTPSNSKKLGIQELVKSLNQVLIKAEGALSSSKEVLAEVRHPLKVGNLEASDAYSSSLQSGLRTELYMSPGAVFRGRSATASMKVKRIIAASKSERQDVVARLLLNGSVAKNFGPLNLEVGVELAAAYEMRNMEKFADFSLEVSKKESQANGLILAALSAKLPVAADVFPPEVIISAPINGTIVSPGSFPVSVPIRARADETLAAFDVNGIQLVAEPDGYYSCRV